MKRPFDAKRPSDGEDNEREPEKRVGIEFDLEVMKDLTPTDEDAVKGGANPYANNPVLI